MALPFPRAIPFVDLLGVELLRFGGGEAELGLDLKDEHSNSLGMAHGGVVMTLLDVVQAHAGRSALLGTPQEGQAMITIEMKTSFMRPSTGRLRAVGRIKHRTRSMAFTEGEVFDAQGRLCAHATGTFKYVTPTPATPPGGSD